MSIQNIWKDIGNIYQRLFDHRPALQGECAYFYQNFEGNKRCEEFDNLLHTSHMLNEAVDGESVERMKNAPFDKVNAKLEAVAAMLERTVNKGTKQYDGYVAEHRRNREQEWAELEAGLERKRREMDEQTNEHLSRLRADMEKSEQQI